MTRAVVLALVLSGCSFLAWTERDPPTPAQRALAQERAKADRAFALGCMGRPEIPLQAAVLPSGEIVVGKVECELAGSDDGQAVSAAVEAGVTVALDSLLRQVQAQYPGAKVTARVREEEKEADE